MALSALASYPLGHSAMAAVTTGVLVTPSRPSAMLISWPFLSSGSSPGFHQNEHLFTQCTVGLALVLSGLGLLSFWLSSAPFCGRTEEREVWSFGGAPRRASDLGRKNAFTPSPS